MMKIVKLYVGKAEDKRVTKVPARPMPGQEPATFCAGKGKPDSGKLFSKGASMGKPHSKGNRSNTKDLSNASLRSAGWTPGASAKPSDKQVGFAASPTALENLRARKHTRAHPSQQRVSNGFLFFFENANIFPKQFSLILNCFENWTTFRQQVVLYMFSRRRRLILQ